MTTNPTANASQGTQPTSPAPQGSPVRLVVLLGLLAIAIGALAFDYAVARPGIDAADEKIHKHVDEANRQSVKEGTKVTPDEIHKLLGKQPTWVEKHPDDQYEVEYYCAWGSVPVLNTRRHYLAVVYLGDEPRRYSSHYKNEVPPIEALPIQQSTPEITDEAVSPPATDEPKRSGAKEGGAEEGKAAAKEPKAGDAPAAEPQDAANPEGGKKQNEKKQAD